MATGRGDRMTYIYQQSDITCLEIVFNTRGDILLTYFRAALNNAMILILSKRGILIIYSISAGRYTSSLIYLFTLIHLYTYLPNNLHLTRHFLLYICPTSVFTQIVLNVILICMIP